MALLDKSGIVDGQRIDGVHVSNIYDALNESGSFTVQASGSFSGSFQGDGSQLTNLPGGGGGGGIFAATGSVQATTNNIEITGSLLTTQGLTTTQITASATINAGPTTEATGLSAFAQGSGSKATGDYSHAIGRGTRATGFAAAAQGLTSTAEGSYSHAEGRLTLASGSYSHAEGHLTTASGDYAHAGGRGTIANGNYQRVIGQFNIATTSATDASAFIIGDGADANNRSNILFAGNGKIELNAPVTASAIISSSDNIFGNRIFAAGYVDTPFLTHAGSPIEINQTLSGSATTTASFGHYIGDGSGLTNLPSSGGSGTQIASGSTSASADPGTGIVVNHSGSTAFSVIGDVGTLFSVDDDLSGTLFSANDVSGLPVLKADASGEVYLGKSPQSLYTTAVVSSTVANVSHSLSTLSTSSYDGAFFEYTATSASNARAGNIMSVWNGANIVFAETTTTDIGDTSDLTTEVIISGSTARLIAYGPNASYKIKTIIKAI